jgi:hypothetical protein
MAQTAYTIAVSKDTGCLVMLKIIPARAADGTPRLKVIGSLSRKQSLELARDVAEWHLDVPKVIAPQPKKLLTLVN